MYIPSMLENVFRVRLKTKILNTDFQGKRASFTLETGKHNLSSAIRKL